MPHRSKLRENQRISKDDRGLRYNVARNCISMKSIRRSPDSIFEMNDCGFESFFATSNCVNPASVRAFFNCTSSAR